MDVPAPRVFSIPPHRPFADSLAAGLLRRAGGAPERLADMLVLLPSRRAVRALQDAFLRIGGGRALLLPAMRAVGDVDEAELAFSLAVAGDDFALPPEISPLRRRLLLAALIERSAPGRYGRDLTPAQAARLAAGLVALIDELQTEGRALADLERLTPARDDLARHWRDVLEFLEILRAPWQGVLQAEGAIEPAERRRLLMQALIARWQASPPEHPVIAAGSTGSIPTTAALLAEVAGLPRGEVVLPGLDRHLDEESWAAVSPAHPQFGMHRLLARLALSREAVADWEPEARTAGSTATPGPRERLLSEALRPAETTERWRDMPALPQSALDGLTVLTCGDADEEARAIALAMREAAEVPGRTAALVTPDRALARRVAAELQRWDIAIDDSGGVPLAQTPPGLFLRLLAEMVEADFHPLALLAALKQPLARFGQAAGRPQRALRRIERALLRGLRPGGGLDGLAVLLRAERPADREAQDLLAALATAAAPFAAHVRDAAPLADILTAHFAMAEALSRDEDGRPTLWQGEAGEAAARFAADLLAGAADLPLAAAAGYPALFATLMETVSVRPRHGRHPRLFIWGPLEARLQHADLLILGGLNERVWPADPGIDPWLNRPMREQIGLPVPERRIGLAAHDFAQAANAPEVILSRAERADGGPTVPSRWLLRLVQTIRIAGLATALSRGERLRQWARALDAPARVRPAPAPDFAPPLAVRPDRLSATQIETLMKDPYAIYARKILALEPLDPIDQAPGAADRGTVVHAALEAYLRGRGDPALAPRARLLALGREAFGALLERPGVRAFWWPRFVRLADWFLERQAARGPQTRTLVLEERGEWRLDLPGGPFTLFAIADRIDRLPDGSLEIIDYKTGAPPTKKDVAAGLAPQLPLEALIVRAGGFADVPAAAALAALSYWRLGGGATPGQEVRIEQDLDDLVARTGDGLRELVGRFRHAGMPYYARPRPAVAPVFDDYDHLSRIQEWSAGGPGDRS